MKNLMVTFHRSFVVEVPDDCEDAELTAAILLDFDEWLVDVEPGEHPGLPAELKYHRTVDTDELLDVRSCAMGGNGDEGTFPQ